MEGYLDREDDTFCTGTDYVSERESAYMYIIQVKVCWEGDVLMGIMTFYGQILIQVLLQVTLGLHAINFKSSLYFHIFLEGILDLFKQQCRLLMCVQATEPKHK